MPCAFRCQHTLPDGTQCNYHAACRRALANHVRFSHSWRQIIPILVVTNQCPLCHSIFASRSIAINHTRAAVNTGTCKADQGLRLHTLQEPAELVCQLCEEHFRDVPSLQRHLVTHFPVRPQYLQLDLDLPPPDPFLENLASTPFVPVATRAETSFETSVAHSVAAPSRPHAGDGCRPALVAEAQDSGDRRRRRNRRRVRSRWGASFTTRTSGLEGAPPGGGDGRRQAGQEAGRCTADPHPHPALSVELGGASSSHWRDFGTPT